MAQTYAAFCGVDVGGGEPTIATKHAPRMGTRLVEEVLAAMPAQTCGFRTTDAGILRLN
ncbi:hypothetical protein [Nocardia sp. NPDC057455]|uniref:hypothetical protein n=1 Tax=Nocardia sp. NPDC057455 TaxID=3346138 RepID=UPI00366DA0D5